MPSAARTSTASNRLVSRSTADSNPVISSTLPISSSVSSSSTSTSTSLPPTSSSSASQSTAHSRINIQRTYHNHSHSLHKHKHKLKSSTSTSQTSNDKPNYSSSSSSIMFCYPSFINHDIPISIQLKRYWKKLNETDSSGKRSRIAQAFAAFKMGLYFKVLITIILIIRISIHSSQRSLPTNAVLYDDFYDRLSLIPSVNKNLPDSRIMIITHPSYSDQLQTLLHSLSKVDYNHDKVSLDIFLFSSSFCNYLPLPLYPLAVAIFGPPRYDHSIATVVNDFQWSYGNKNLIAVKSEPDLIHSWQSNINTINETLIFMDLINVQSISPSFYTWLKKVKSSLSMNSHVISLDSITLPPKHHIPHGDYAILSQQFFPGASVFSPSQDIWINFQKWFAIRVIGKGWGVGSAFARPKLPTSLKLGGFHWWNSLKEWPYNAWFSMFLAEYEEKIVYPVLPNGQTFVTRPSGTTSGEMPGTGEITKPLQLTSTTSTSLTNSNNNNNHNYHEIESGSVHLSKNAEFESSLFQSSSSSDFVIPEQPVLLHADFSVSSLDSPSSLYSSHFINSSLASSTSNKQRIIYRHLPRLRNIKKTAFIEDIVPSGIDASAASLKYTQTLQNIVDFAKSRGRQSISITFVSNSEPVLKMSQNWICNVGALDIAPPAMVMIAVDDYVQTRLSNMIKAYPSIGQGSRIISIHEILASSSSPSSSKDEHDHSHNLRMKNSVRDERNSASTDMNEMEEDEKYEDHYWRLCLVKSMMMRDLLQKGLAVLHFETRQTWLNDPLPYIRHELHTGRTPVLNKSNRRNIDVVSGSASLIEDYRIPDVIMSTTGRNEEVNGRNLFYIRPSIVSKHVFCKLIDKLWQSFQQYDQEIKSMSSSSSSSSRKYFNQFRRRKTRKKSEDEWNHILSSLMTGKDWFYSRSYPRVKLGLLNHDLFVDGQWFTDFDADRLNSLSSRKNRIKYQKVYSSSVSSWPVVVSSDHLDNTDDHTYLTSDMEEREKIKRLRRFGLWFVTSDRCDESLVKRALKNGHFGDNFSGGMRRTRVRARARA